MITLAQLADGGGLAALAVALFWIGISIRGDARMTRRWQAAATELEKRMRRLERQYDRERARRRQLETVMRKAGMQLPAWPALDADDDDDPHPEPSTATVIQLPWRNR